MEKILFYVFTLVALGNGDYGEHRVQAVRDVNPYEHLLRVRSVSRGQVGEPGSVEDAEIPSQSDLRVCKPGSTKMEDCNSCFCIEDGSGWGCTEKACYHEQLTISIVNEDMTPESDAENPLELDIQVCDPGSTKMDDCNSCFCKSDGSGWGCTKIGCITNLDITPQPEAGNPLEPGMQICEPGSTKMVHCNRCTCVNDGSAWGCTRRFCSEQEITISNPDITPTPEAENPSQSGPQVCEPGSTKWDGCNNCFCTVDGSGWGCTQRGCHWEQLSITNPDMTPVPEVENPSEPGSKICEPGSTKMVDCNRCNCGSDGSAWACTKQLCTQEITISESDIVNAPDAGSQSLPVLEICVSGSTMIDNGFRCRCVEDGSAWTCIKMDYKHQEMSIIHQDADPTPSAEPPQSNNEGSDATFSCKPNETYEDGCNQCTCAPDGRSAVCTAQGCAPEKFQEKSPITSSDA